MRTGTPISEGCPTRVNGSAQSGLSCAIVLNSAGESVRHFIMASRLAAQLRFVTRAAPAMCASVRLRLFVDAEAHVQLSRPYWRQRVISSRLWDEIETYPPLPPVADAMRGSQGSAHRWSPPRVPRLPQSMRAATKGVGTSQKAAFVSHSRRRCRTPYGW